MEVMENEKSSRTRACAFSRVRSLEAGKDVLYLGFSSGLSGTFNAGAVAAGELAEKYPQYLTERYNITEFDNNLQMYETLCKRRGFILRGGEFDYERGAKAIIDDFRKGRIGRICLEKSADYKDFEF